MSECIITRHGGSGGLSPNSAVIHVTAPAGSTISFSKGGVIVKTIGPEKSHVNAEDNTLADWYYAVSSSNYGTWTVTATRGTETASDTIIIDSNKQYDLGIAYSIYLYNSGAYAAGITHSVIKDPSGCSATDGSTYIELATKSGSTSNIYTRWGLIDLTGHSTLTCVMQRRVDSNAGTHCVAAFITQNSSVVKYDSADIKTSSVAESVPTSYQDVTLTLDVSDASGEWYVAVGEYTTSTWNNIRYAKIISVLLN